jgi:type III restriction enzyme
MPRPAPAAAHVREQVAAYEAEHAHEAAPAELGQTFVAPRLMAQMQGELVFADTDRLNVRDQIRRAIGRG